MDIFNILLVTVWIVFIAVCLRKLMFQLSCVILSHREMFFQPQFANQPTWNFMVQLEVMDRCDVLNWTALYIFWIFIQKIHGQILIFKDHIKYSNSYQILPISLSLPKCYSWELSKQQIYTASIHLLWSTFLCSYLWQYDVLILENRHLSNRVCIQFLYTCSIMPNVVIHT